VYNVKVTIIIIILLLLMCRKELKVS